MDVEAVKNMTGADLDKIGDALTPPLVRVSVAHGHAFDEDDDSYRRRLLAHEIGPEAAGAMSQPMRIVDDKVEKDAGAAETDAAAVAAKAKAGADKKPAADDKGDGGKPDEGKGADDKAK